MNVSGLWFSCFQNLYSEYFTNLLASLPVKMQVKQEMKFRIMKQYSLSSIMCKRQFFGFFFFNNSVFWQISISYFLFFLTTGNHILAINVLKVNNSCSGHIPTAN